MKTAKDIYGDHYVRALKETEEVDGMMWRLLPQAIEVDALGQYWIPESRVETFEDLEDD